MVSFTMSNKDLFFCVGIARSYGPSKRQTGKPVSYEATIRYTVLDSVPVSVIFWVVWFIQVQP
jgi:hypothetical protein